MISFLARWNPFYKHKDQAPDTVKENSIAAAITSAESELVWLQNLVAWENPVSSVMALIVLHASVWLVNMMQLRVMFVLAMLMLFRLVRTEWKERIWPEIRVPPPVAEDTEPWADISASALSAPELIKYAERLQRAGGNVLASMANVRSTTPLLFVVAANTCWATLYVVSRCVSGALLAQLGVTLLMTVPAALLHLLPPGTSDKLCRLVSDTTHALQSTGLMTEADCESEFVPESSPETRAYLDAVADIFNGRQPSPECHEVAAFSSGLEAAPAFDDSDDTDDELAPSIDNAAHLKLGSGGDTVDLARDAPAAGLSVQALSSATQLLSTAGRLMSAAYGAPASQQLDSDSEFELIGEEEAHT